MELLHLCIINTRSCGTLLVLGPRTSIQYIGGSGLLWHLVNLVEDWILHINVQHLPGSYKLYGLLATVGLVHRVENLAMRGPCIRSMMT